MSPELQNSIRTQLSKFFDNTESERFFDLDYAINRLNQPQPPWEALVSIGIHAAEFYANREKEEVNQLLKDLTNTTLTFVDKLFLSILPVDGEELLGSEQKRLLFHTRFTLGFLLLIQGDKKRSHVALHDMAATKTRAYITTEPGELSRTNDIINGKIFAFVYLFSEYSKQRDWSELLFLLTECIACAPIVQPFEAFAPKILDLWAINQQKENEDTPGLEWLHAFVEAGELLLLNNEDDSANTPNKCKEGSAQYLAWKVGQIVGIFANKFHDDPFSQFRHYESTLGEKEYRSERGEQKTEETIVAILAVLREFDTTSDWQKMRDRCLYMWNWTSTTGWKESARSMDIPLDVDGPYSLSEIGPCHDLYWAMRIGFADIFIGHNSSIPAINQADSTFGSTMWNEIENIISPSPRKVPRLSKEELITLIENGESETLEFKSSARWDYQQKCQNEALFFELIETISGFLNGFGGKLIIGVDDNKNICGLDKDIIVSGKNLDRYQLYITEKLCQYLGRVECQQYVSVEFYNILNKYVCLVNVKSSRTPIYVRDTQSEYFYLRIQNRTQKLSMSEAHKYVIQNFPNRFGQI
jgi:hypothetical protein